ncbi:MAG: type I restriction enzyme HsdR N-terminal domain-containing protein [Mycoplasma sp.]
MFNVNLLLGLGITLIVLVFLTVVGFLWWFVRHYSWKNEKRLEKKQILTPVSMSNIKFFFKTFGSYDKKALKRINKNQANKIKKEKVDLINVETKIETKDDFASKVFNLIQNNSDFKELVSRGDLKEYLNVPFDNFKTFFLSRKEEQVRIKFSLKLEQNYKIGFNQQHYELPVKFGSNNGFVDISLFPNNVEHNLNNAICLIECKHEEVSEEVIEESKKQLMSYLSVVNGAKMGLTTNFLQETFYTKEITSKGEVKIEETTDFLLNLKNLLKESEGF